MILERKSIDAMDVNSRSRFCTPNIVQKTTTTPGVISNNRRSRAHKKKSISVSVNDNAFASRIASNPIDSFKDRILKLDTESDVLTRLTNQQSYRYNNYNY